MANSASRLELNILDCIILFQRFLYYTDPAALPKCF
uniref:Uncharacterized protein n=1 Tax=Setaria italica TaxID=4555 RepID=K3YNP5_SETIT